MTEVDLDQPYVTDRPASERFPIYTRANVSEIWQGPSTPLTYTTQAGMLFDLAWRKALVQFGAFDMEEFDSDHEEFIGVFYGYPYLNVSIQRVFGVRMPGATPELIDDSFFGEQEGVPPYQPDPRDESPEHTQRITKVIAEVLETSAVPRLAEDRRKVEELRAARPDFTGLSTLELWQYAEPLISDWFGEIMIDHMFITSASAIPIGIVQAMAAAQGDPGLAIRALAGFGDVVSAAPAYAMWEMSRLVAGSPALSAEFDRGITNLLDRLRADGGSDQAEFLARFDELIYQFGSRGTNEMNLASPTWETDPDVVLTAIERMRLQPDDAAPKHGLARLAADREAAAAQLAARVDDAARQQLDTAMRAASIWLPARELSKYNHVRLQHEGRMALMEVGRRMVEDGVFDHVEDFVMIRRDEWESFVAAPGSWTEEIRHRREWARALAELDPPFITEGAPSPPSTWRRRTEPHASPVRPGEVISGIAACSGSATGIARVITDPLDGGELEPGEILVAASTDPSWTPLFVSAAAVVVDIGAPLSHAAIVSRELGVPCVVSATSASRRIPSGSRITVDGTNGTVTVESVAEPGGG